MQSEALLLDTHVWIWLMNGDITLPTKIRKSINLAAENDEIYVSSISTWEVSMLEAYERITLGRPCLEWIKASLECGGLNLITLSPEIAVESVHLPGNFHGDPADRILVATARLEGLTLVTRDSKILQYAKKNFVKALKA